MKNCEECPSCYLKEIPTDVHDIIIDKQAIEKKKRRNSNGKGIEQSIYAIIREWNMFMNTKPVIQIDEAGNFIVLKSPIDEFDKAHIINAINVKMKK